METQTEYTKFIKDKLRENKDADDIMLELLNKFNSIDEFRDALCNKSTNVCVYIELRDILVSSKKINENRNDEFWRLRSKINTICNDVTCNIEEIKIYYKDLKDAKDKAAKTYSSMTTADIIVILSQMPMSAGNQKGGDWLKIVTLLAGIDNVVSRIYEVQTQSYNGLYALCEKAVTAIYNAPTAISKCLRSIMGDTLYKILKNVAKGVIGAGVLTEIYENIESFQTALISIIKYIPYTVGLLNMLSIGLVFFKLVETLGDNTPELIESAKIIVTDAVNVIDESDFNKIIDNTNSLKTKIVDTITQKLIQAGATQQALNAQEMEEFETTIHEILNNAILSPESIAQKGVTIAHIKATSDVMVAKIKKNIEDANKLADERGTQAQQNKKSRTTSPAGVNPMDTAGVNPMDTAGVKPMDTAGVKPMDTAGVNPMDTAGVNPMDTAGVKPMDTAGVKPMDTAGVNPMDTAGGKPRRKTTRKPRKKPHKKSRKQKRSRKH